LSKSISAAQLTALQAANLCDGNQVAATEIVLHARGSVPAIDIPIRIIIRKDLY
jgi:hypothetical protein